MKPPAPPAPPVPPPPVPPGPPIAPPPVPPVAPPPAVPEPPLLPPLPPLPPVPPGPPLFEPQAAARTRIGSARRTITSIVHEFAAAVLADQLSPYSKSSVPTRRAAAPV